MTTVAKLQVLLRSRLNMTSLFFSSSFSLSISLLCFCVLFGCFLSFHRECMCMSCPSYRQEYDDDMSLHCPLRLARPVVFSNHGPNPDPASEIFISPTVGQARFATYIPSRRASLSGLACDIFRPFLHLFVFKLCLLLLEIWRPRPAR